MATANSFALLCIVCWIGNEFGRTLSLKNDLKVSSFVAPSVLKSKRLESDRYHEFVDLDKTFPRTENKKLANYDYEKIRNNVNYHLDVCPDNEATFYRNFDQVVKNVTRGARIEHDNTQNQCTCTNKGFIFCNCSSSHWNDIPILNPDLNGLDLYKNNVRLLKIGAFQRYPKLKYLSLQSNKIAHLPLQCFHGLSQLLVLDLRDNKLSMTNGTYQVGVFKDLSSLIALRINANNEEMGRPGLFYPDEALADLRSLQFLSMDGISNQDFGRGFGKLVNLETLSLSGFLDGNCKLNSLTHEAFRYLSQIKMLNLSDCYLENNNVDAKSLQYLKNIHTIDFTWNEYLTVMKLTQILSTLRYSGMKELFARRVVWRFSPGIRINKSLVENLPRNLTCLVASGNSINFISSEVLGALPKTLRYIDFSGNKLVFGSYLQNLTNLISLETLILNGAEYTFKIPQTYRFKRSKSRQIPLDSRQDVERSSLKMGLPPNLRVLKMEYAGLWYYLTELNVNPNNTLEELHLNLNYFPSITGPFNGFNKLKKLELKRCQVKYISKRFFANFPSLEHLNLYGNLIGLGYTLAHHPFENLSNLKYLNLSFNDVLYLRNDTFRGLSNLRELHFANNTIFDFNADISKMSELQILNLQSTSIHTLHKATRRHIDTLRNITVLISGSPLDCDCTNLDFLNWMALDKNNIIPKNTTYICVLNNRADVSVNWPQFLSEVRNIRRECASNYWLFLVVLGVTVVLLFLLTGSIMYRFRLRLRYLYYAFDIRMSTTNVEKDDKKFKYDVFISYSNEDLNFVLRTVTPELHSRGLTTCIHSRDFRAGEHVITNIIRCVKASRKTLIVLTKNFISSKWCHTEFQMAREESAVSGRKIIVFLIADKIPKNKAGLELLTHIQQNTYIPYHGVVDNSEHGQDTGERPTSTREVVMWDKLVQDINS